MKHNELELGFIKGAQEFGIEPEFIDGYVKQAEETYNFYCEVIKEAEAKSNDPQFRTKLAFELLSANLNPEVIKIALEKGAEEEGGPGILEMLGGLFQNGAQGIGNHFGGGTQGAGIGGAVMGSGGGALAGLLISKLLGINPLIGMLLMGSIGGGLGHHFGQGGAQQGANSIAAHADPSVAAGGDTPAGTPAPGKGLGLGPSPLPTAQVQDPQDLYNAQEEQASGYKPELDPSMAAGGDVPAGGAGAGLPGMTHTLQAPAPGANVQSPEDAYNSYSQQGAGNTTAPVSQPATPAPGQSMTPPAPAGGGVMTTGDATGNMPGIADAKKVNEQHAQQNLNTQRPQGQAPNLARPNEGPVPNQTYKPLTMPTVAAGTAGVPGGAGSQSPLVHGGSGAAAGVVNGAKNPNLMQHTTISNPIPGR